MIVAPNSPSGPGKRQDHAGEDARQDHGKVIVQEDPNALDAECAGGSSAAVDRIERSRIERPPENGKPIKRAGERRAGPDEKAKTSRRMSRTECADGPFGRNSRQQR